MEGGAYGAVSHACAMAVADAVANLRNIQTIAGAVIGVALEQILSGADPIAAQQALEAAQNLVQSAVVTLGFIGETTEQILGRYPRVAPHSPD
jgi:hypothetical protein